MPFKHNNSRRHKFKKAKYRVTNWSEYNDALRKRGDITVWFTDGAIDAWVPERVPGQKGRPVEYSKLAIECCLIFRQVFRLPLRQTEGLLTSLVQLMDFDIVIPGAFHSSGLSISFWNKSICHIFQHIPSACLPIAT